MNDLVTVTPKILELNQSNDIYMTVRMVILSDQVNYNNLMFTEDFIDGVVENKDKYITIPVVVNREKLENEEYDELNHEFSNGKLNTDIIGGFSDFYKEIDDDGVSLLIGEARIHKRFPKTCKAIKELFENDDLEFSCEVMVRKYKEVTDDDIRVVHYNDGKNTLFGHAIVSEPAESRAKATILVAEALNKDLKGGEQVEKYEFNNGVKVKYHGKIELNSMKLDDVFSIVYNKLNPVDVKSGYRKYNYYITDFYTDHVIAQSYEGDSIYRIPITIEKEDVILANQDDWVEGYRGFIPNGVNYEDMLSIKENEIDDLNTQINSLKEEIKEMEKKTQEELTTELSNKETEINNLIEKIEELESKVTELNETIVSQEGSKKDLETEINSLKEKIDELTPFKEQVEKAEKDAKMTELNEKFSKLLDEETFKSEKVQNAIQELNEVELNSIVVEHVTQQKTVEVNSKEDDVVIEAVKGKDLIGNDLASKYGLNL